MRTNGHASRCIVADGNSIGRSGDNRDMRCAAARELISAMSDGEATELERRGAEAHLRGCAACRAYAMDLGAVDVASRPPAARSIATEPIVVFLRLALLTVAGALVVLALPPLIQHLTGDHTVAESGHLVAWDLAFAAGLIVVAVQPFRARGLLPMAIAVAGVMVVTLLLDTVGGHPSPMSAASHLLELVGLVLLWQLERLQFPRARRVRTRLPDRPQPTR